MHLLAVALFVRKDYFLNQRVADNVLVGELEDADALDIVKYFQRIDKTAFAKERKVYLSDIAGDDGFAVVTQTGEEHFHLLGRGVLSLVENDECIVKRSAAHIRKRYYFDNSLFSAVVEAFVAEHFIQCIVKRTEIRVDFALKVAGEEAELFACFNGRSCKNDLGNLLFLQCVYSHCNRKEGFTSTCGADTEDYRV